MKILLVILSALLLASCEGRVSGSGTIVSAADSKPIDSVLIHWSGHNRDTYSDKFGHFEIGAFVGCPAGCPNLELTFSKKGYEPKYINFDKAADHINSLGRDSLLVRMVLTNKIEALARGHLSIPLLLLEILISLLNVATLGYIIITKTRYKIAWIIAIVIFSVTIRYNYLDNTFEGQFFSFLLRFENDFGWYTYFIPTTAIIFWIDYFINRKKINSA